MGWGDEIMVTGRARVLFRSDPKRKVVVRDKHGMVRYSEMWWGNPYISTDNRNTNNTQNLIDGPSRRPYHLDKTKERWTYNLGFRPDAGDIYFMDEELGGAAKYSPQIVIAPSIKAKASPNKQWGHDRWTEFARLATNAGFTLTQMGSVGTVEIENVNTIPTHQFRMACAILSRAKAYVGHEGGLHHAAAALGIPGVVIFGGFTPVELTGYAIHRNLGASLGEACGWRTPCKHCDKWMASITPERVLEELRGVLNVSV